MGVAKGGGASQEEVCRIERRRGKCRAGKVGAKEPEEAVVIRRGQGGGARQQGGAGLRGGAGPRTGSGPGRMQGKGRSQGLGRDRTEAELEGEKWRRRSRETARAKRKMGSVAEAGGGAEGCFSSCVEEHHHTPSRLFLLALWFDFYRRPMSRPSFSQAGSL